MSSPYINGGAMYTMRLHQAIDLAPDTENGPHDIGLYTYPIHKAEHRAILNKKIVEHYYNQEIGMETIALFRLAMRRKMNEIMPVYNELYKSLEFDYDPMRTTDMTTDYSANDRGTVNGKSNGNDTATAINETLNGATSRVVSSDTPQIQLSGNGDYASGIVDSGSNSKADSESTTETTSSNTSENVSESESEALTRIYGYSGSPSELIAQFRNNIINIDLAIIDELGELFMGIWGSETSYTGFYGTMGRNIYLGGY